LKIIIVGNGKTGLTLARQLSSEDHDLVLVDSNVEALHRAEETLDVLCVAGNGASISVLLQAGCRTADLVIAVTDLDEVNAMCCLIAKRIGAKHTIARIRNPDYFRDAALLKKETGLDMVINPEYAAAQEVARILRVPSAFSVETFANGRVDLIGFTVQSSDGIADVRLDEYSRAHPSRTLMCAALRGNEVIIPNGAFIPKVGDKVYAAGSQSEMVKLFTAMRRTEGRIRSVSILGGSRTAIYLTWALDKMGIQTRLVERDPQKCIQLAEKLPHTMIIQGDGTDEELIESEGIFDVDALIALTGRDEENLLMAMAAQQAGVSKALAKMTHPNYVGLVRNSGIDSIISPKEITADYICSFVRAMANSEGSAVESLYKLLNGAIEAAEFTVKETTAFRGIPLREVRLKPGILIAAIVRDGVTLIPNGSTAVEKDDRIIVIAKSVFLQDLNEILQD
jgi:trk system potassium uptake protein TrkA